MVKEKVVINNESGLHMRPAGIFVKEIQRFKSDAYFMFRDVEYNAKSMLNVLSASVKKGDEIELVISGEDEDECLRAAKAAIAGGLGE